MTIKEIEELTGMSRANIRYYESEGLVAPERNKENGYRVYSENDAKILLKIKLLRSLDIPLEAVKALRSGKEELLPALDRHLRDLAEKQEQLERSGEISRLMIAEGETFDTLEPRRYLDALETGAEQVLQQDVSPRLNLPWRRYWARTLDFAFYNTLVSVALRDFQNRTLFIPILTLLAMLLLEPLLLSLFATTPGKAVFGIRVTDREGARLDYNTGVERTWTVMWEGEALHVPLICLYFQYKSLDLAEREIPLSWEEDSELTYQDDKKWRYALFLAAYAGLIWAEVMLLGG